MKEKALVMEVNKDNVILLTRDGRFISRRLSGLCPQVGEEIEVGEEKKSKVLWLPLSFIAAAAVFFVLFFSGNWWNNYVIPSFSGGVVAYVTVDINPSVELGLNKDNIVVTVRGLNEDGKVLLEKIDLKGRTGEEAIDAFVAAAAKEGYLNPEKENQILINMSTKDAVKTEEQKVTQTIIEKTEKTLEKQNLHAKVEVINTDLEIREKAKEVNLSAGKYALLVEAKDAGFDVDVKSIKRLGLVKAIKAAGGDPEEIIKTAKEEKDFSEKIKKWQVQLNQELKELKEWEKIKNEGSNKKKPGRNGQGKLKEEKEKEKNKAKAKEKEFKEKDEDKNKVKEKEGRKNFDKSEDDIGEKRDINKEQKVRKENKNKDSGAGKDKERDKNRKDETNKIIDRKERKNDDNDKKPNDRDDKKEAYNEKNEKRDKDRDWSKREDLFKQIRKMVTRSKD